jgi:hypothetical protein
MKKIYILFFLLMLALTINANPIPVPTIEISELYFDESDNWKLELGYSYINPEGYTFDSIFILSSADTAKIADYFLTGEIGQFVITTDSLTTDFRINRLGDTIKVISYAYGGKFEDILIFGNVLGASINYPRVGQSLSKNGYFYVKDNSPTIEFSNDTIGTCGTLKGVIYDKYSEPVENRIFSLDNYFETSENGEFSARVYSKPSTFNRIDYKTGQYSTQSVSITEISYVMEPDSVIEMNIYLLDTLVTGINDINIANTPISVYPNPISKSGELKINIDLPIITSNIYVEIIDLNGKLISKKKISQNSSSIIAPDKSGLYIVRTLLDSEMISSNRIIVNE